jgi:hypothetical protein
VEYFDIMDSRCDVDGSNFLYDGKTIVGLGVGATYDSTS